MACPACGSKDIRDDVRPIGPHYGKRVCANGHFNGWLPHPPADTSRLPEGLAALIVDRTEPVKLRGTPAQVSAALPIRAAMDRFAGYSGRADFVRLIRCVKDASWFLANRGRSAVTLRCWPTPEQMEEVEAKTS